MGECRFIWRRVRDRREVLLIVAILMNSGCSIMATRPIQLMSDTSAAIKAAKEVQADVLAPELYRQSNEWFFKAKHEYKFKNFHLAKEYAQKARIFAEQAEFESVRNGGNRVEAGGVDPLSNSPEAATPSTSSDGPSVSEPIPRPQGTPAEEYDQRKAAEDEARKKAEEEAKKAETPQPTPAPTLEPTFFPPRRR